MYQEKHREDLAEVMDTFGCSVREATMEALYEDYSCGGLMIALGKDMATIDIGFQKCLWYNISIPDTGK